MTYQEDFDQRIEEEFKDKIDQEFNPDRIFEDYQHLEQLQEQSH